MSTEKKITTGEVVGHLRAASRLFKSFEFANEAAELVLKAESSVRKLEKEIDSLEKEKSKLDQFCDKLVERANGLEIEISDHQKAVKSAIEVASALAQAQSVKAKSEAKGIVDKALKEAANIESRKDKAMSEMMQAESGQRKAEAKLIKIEKEVNQAKEAFMKAVG